MSLSREAIDALLPGGSLWQPESGADLDLLLDGMASNIETMRLFLHTLARIRNPLLTTVLSDLEREYGIIPDSRVSDTVRRQRLLATKTDGSSDGTLEWVQDKLTLAGFEVQLHSNDPAVNPATFLDFDTSPQFDEPTALFGPEGQYFVCPGGSLLVNGPVYYNQLLVDYTSPAATQYWPMVFFIGGGATRGSSNELIALEWAKVPIIRKAEFIRLIIKYKPMHTWVGMKIDYV